MLDHVLLHVCDLARPGRARRARAARTLRGVAVLALLAGAASAAQPASAAASAAPPAATPPPTALAAPATAAPSAAELHALGVLLSRQLASFDLSEAEFRAVAEGFADGYHHPTAATAQARNYIPQLQALEGTRAKDAEQREERAGQRYLERVAALPHARKTTSGLVYLPIAQGSGATPRATDQVTVQYTGKLIDGSVFDSSAQHGGSATFTLSGVIPCWSQGLQLMKVGGSARLVCPAALAYGQRGVGGVINPGSTLDFEVKLLAVKSGPPPGLPSPLGGPPPGPPGSPGSPAPH